MTKIEAGTFLLGSGDADAVAGDGEGPARDVALEGFLIDRTAVSNARFDAFVDATGYRTDAERFGWSFVFEGQIGRRRRLRRAGEVRHAPWWIGVRGACWRHPEGPGSDLADRGDHPAVHVSWNDAAAYCAWAGKRLPSENEWEAAARGGLRGRRFPWGDELSPDGAHRCNIWQGRFPERNTRADGYAGTAPVTAFAANGYGLYNCSGNVWEWCADRFAVPRALRTPRSATERPSRNRVLKGGSYLCHASYCNRYRVAARYANTPHTSSGHAGFRCAADA